MSDTEGDTTMIDEDAIREEKMMYGHGTMSEQEMNDKYPNRPHNHSKTLPFSDLYLKLFNPLQNNKKKPPGAGAAAPNRKKLGPDSRSPNEIRRVIIENFIALWRNKVGNDIFPALRLIIPEKDRDRGMYGLKELTIGKILVRVMKIDKNSDDGYNMLHWKLPGVKSSSAMAGDFAGRCYEVIAKRPMRTSPGDMTIAEVNELLDRLSVAQKEENQRPIIEEFYNRMNAEEMMWLIRIILRQMKVGATEKTILDLWHDDAENLFNISSSLRRVCWELYDRDVRLEGDDKGIHLMQCFQPQLAAFQMCSMEQMVARMRPEGDDAEFWIEEKLDGERMQLHMMSDPSVPGGRRFSFWSRKAKDYTYLYGAHLSDESGALTKHLTSAFPANVQNSILDGEMITWNMDTDKIFPFGHLKTAAISEQTREAAFDAGNRPLYRVFDCLYFNSKDLTRYTLRDRRRALEATFTPVDRRLEIHPYDAATSASAIEPKLRAVVAERSEGLVLKNPRAAYSLNTRNDDWIKVKPEYMTEFGEALDCVVIGGYYGSGKRGGGLSSFLCGLRCEPHMIGARDDPHKCYSFFKVGGGFSASDYADLRHRTEGKWHDWDVKNPPNHLIVLGGWKESPRKYYERPDCWIRPEDSVVLEVKAASITTTDQFASMLTLRFPRFKRLRTDKTWDQSLSHQEFRALRAEVEEERDEKKFKVEAARKTQGAGRKRKKALVVLGQEAQPLENAYGGPAATKVLEGAKFFVMTEALKPLRKSKMEIEAFVKANGGSVVASEKDPETTCVADRNLVKVASMVKRGERTVVRPRWLWDVVEQSERDGRGREAYRLPLEQTRHVFASKIGEEGSWEENVDVFGDSFARDVGVEELRVLFGGMPDTTLEAGEASEILGRVMEHGEVDEMPGWMFQGLTAYFDGEGSEAAERVFAFAGGRVAKELADEGITHAIVGGSSADMVRQELVSRSRLPRMVSADWVTESWKEKTRLDEEREYWKPMAQAEDR